MKVWERAVRFEEVDAARIVFFAHYAAFAHEAMEDLFSDLQGGYARLILERKVGLPAVDLKVRYLAPLRYGDRMRIETRTLRLGNRSAQLGYRVLRGDGVLCAELEHTVVTSDLEALVSCAMPTDVRAVFERHLDPLDPREGGTHESASA